MRLRVSPKARRDLNDIWKYIARDSLVNADRLILRLFEVFALLTKQPALGSSSDEIEPGTRKFPVGNYNVYYRIGIRSIQILHVFHAKRDQHTAFHGNHNERFL